MQHVHFLFQGFSWFSYIREISELFRTQFAQIQKSEFTQRSKVLETSLIFMHFKLKLKPDFTLLKLTSLSSMLSPLTDGIFQKYITLRGIILIFPWAETSQHIKVFANHLITN